MMCLEEKHMPFLRANMIAFVSERKPWQKQQHQQHYSKWQPALTSEVDLSLRWQTGQHCQTGERGWKWCKLVFYWEACPGNQFWLMKNKCSYVRLDYPINPCIFYLSVFISNQDHLALIPPISRQKMETHCGHTAGQLRVYKPKMPISNLTTWRKPTQTGNM